MTKKFITSDRGAAAVEAVFIFPFMVFLYFGLFDVTGLITLNRRITSVSGTISDTIAQVPNPIEKANVDDIMKSADIIIRPTPIANVHVDVYNFRYVSGAATKIWKLKNSSPGTCPEPAASTYSSLIQSGGVATNDLIVAVTCTNYTPYIATFMGNNILGSTSIHVQQTIATRPRSKSPGQLDCYMVGTSGTKCPTT